MIVKTLVKRNSLHRIALAITVIPVILSGCGSLSGMDASDKFGCKAPTGVHCQSVSGVYYNARANNLPSQRGNGDSENTDKGNGDKRPAVLTTNSTVPVALRQVEPTAGSAIRSAPRELRVWIAPWLDTEEDLNDQSYVYLTLDKGHWLIEHNQRRIQDGYSPIPRTAFARIPKGSPTQNTDGAGKDDKIQSQGNTFERLIPDSRTSRPGAVNSSNAIPSQTVINETINRMMENGNVE